MENESISSVEWVRYVHYKEEWLQKGGSVCTYKGSSYPRNSLMSVKFLAFHLRSDETVLSGDWVNGLSCQQSLAPWHLHYPSFSVWGTKPLYQIYSFIWWSGVKLRALCWKYIRLGHAVLRHVSKLWSEGRKKMELCGLYFLMATSGYLFFLCIMFLNCPLGTCLPDDYIGNVECRH